MIIQKWTISFDEDQLEMKLTIFMKNDRCIGKKVYI